jgi:hypothetical protein
VSELVALRRGRAGQHLRTIADPRLAKVLAGTLSPHVAALPPVNHDREAAE